MSSRAELLRGAGSYLTDLCRGEVTWATFVRSIVPHGIIKHVNVVGSSRFYSGIDLADMVQPLRVPGNGLLEYDIYPLARDRALFVGEAVGVVLADNPYEGEDCADAVEVEYEALPPIVNAADALTGSTLLHPSLGTNVLYVQEVRYEEAEEAVRSAPVQLERTFRYPRQTAVPLHGRGVLARYEGNVLTVYTSTQAPFAVRSSIAESLSLAEDQVRVVRPDVGGGFGSKSHVYGEEIAVAALAHHLRQPVCWVEDRRESLIASTHAHETEIRIRVGATNDGLILASAGEVVADVGAHSIRYAGATLEPFTTTAALLAPYRVPVTGVRSKGVATNKAPAGAYRGVGFVPGTFASERMIDHLAARLDLDSAELRLRNLLTSSDFPYRTPLNAIYDGGDYKAVFEEGLKAANYEPKHARRTRESSDQTRTGVGIAAAHMPAALGSSAFRRQGSPMLGGYDGARVHVAPDGSVQAFLSSSSTGQGHDIAYAQLVGRLLGIDPMSVTVIEGDTSLCPAGTATLADRSAVVIGASLHLACDDISSKIRRIASAILNVKEDQVVVTDGVAFARGSSEKSVPIKDVALAAYLRLRDFALPAGMEPGLESTRFYDPENSTYGFASHIATVGVNLMTGEVKLLRYVLAKDTGEIINEAIVHEQAIGSIATGIGHALLESVSYSEDGQPLTASMMDYLLPTAYDVPPDILVLNVPTPGFAPGGYRGAGNLGTVGAPAAIANAVADALGDQPQALDEMPLTPERVLRAAGKIG